MNWDLIWPALLAALCVTMWVRLMMYWVRNKEPEQNPEFLGWKQMLRAWKEFKKGKNTE